jgi:concanavalin A-like lectin/glucanase superfamily protein
VRSLSSWSHKTLESNKSVGGTYTVNKAPEAGSPASGSLTNGLVGYWSFDGADISNTRAFDRSGRGNDGTLTNGPKLAKGRLGQGLHFDGDDACVDVGNVSTLKIGTSDWSIAAWFKSNTDSNPDFIIAQGNPYNAAGSGYDLAYRGDANRIEFRYNDGSGETDLRYGNITQISGAWHHVAVTLDRDGQAKLYFDGVEAVSAAAGEPGTIQGTNNFIISGLQNCTAGNSIDGAIDDVRVYNRVLSADEVKRLYNMGHIN